VADEVQRQYILGFLSESAYPLDDAPRVHPIAQDGDALRRPPAQASIRQQRIKDSRLFAAAGKDVNPSSW
jgi:hypothetical protein